MTTETQAAPTTEAAPLFKGRHLPCIKCGEVTAIRLALDDGLMSCYSCEGEFTPEDVLAVIEAWGPVLRWLAEFPQS